MTPVPEDPQRKKSPWVQVGRYSQLAFMLPAGTVAGYLLGSLLDRSLHTSWILIVGLILGTVALAALGIATLYIGIMPNRFIEMANWALGIASNPTMAKIIH